MKCFVDCCHYFAEEQSRWLRERVSALSDDVLFHLRDQNYRWINAPSRRSYEMATIERVTELFKARIEKDSSKQMKKAGDIWRDLPFNFFYLTHADDTVDIVVKSITRQIAKEDGVKLPSFVFKNLEDMVGPKTAVKEGIRLVFLTSFTPQPTT
jgi:hypothetical protein